MAASSIRRASSSSSVLACLADTEEPHEEDQDFEHGCLTISGLRVTEPLNIKNIRRWYLLIEVDGWFLQVGLKSQQGSLSAMHTHASFQNVTSASRVRFELWATKSRGRHPDRIVALGLLEPTARPLFQILSAGACVYDLSMHILEPYATNMTNLDLLNTEKKMKKHQKKHTATVHSLPPSSASSLSASAPSSQPSSSPSNPSASSSSHSQPALLLEDNTSTSSARNLLELKLRVQLGFVARQQDNQPRRMQSHLPSDCKWIIPTPTSREYVAMLLEAMVGRSSLLEQMKRDRGKFGALHRAIDRLAKFRQERPGRSEVELQMIEKTNQDVYHQLGLLPKHRRRRQLHKDEDEGYEHRANNDGYHDDDDDDGANNHDDDDDDDKDTCYVCMTDYVDFGRQVLMLDCQHTLHFECAQAQIRSIARQPGGVIGFAQARCGVCRSWLRHSYLNRALVDAKKVYDVTVRLAVQAWEAEEGADSTQARPSDDELLATMRFYSCYQCGDPFYGGRIECGDALDPQPELVKCERCLRRAIENCAEHGTNYIAFKCRWCCQPSSYFCFGHTHFCSPCHQLYPNMKITVCPGPPVCEGNHPPNDGLTEHCLGCVACHAERTRPLPPTPTPSDPTEQQIAQQAQEQPLPAAQEQSEPSAEQRRNQQQQQAARYALLQKRRVEMGSSDDDQYDESGTFESE